MKNESVINLLHTQRKHYEKKQRFHYLNFAALALILLLDLIIISYTAIPLNGYAWSGIIFLFTLLGVEAIQYNDFKKLKESVDDFYLEGEYIEPKK